MVRFLFTRRQHSFSTSWTPTFLVTMTARTAELKRKTNETSISVSLNLDAPLDAQQFDINTGIGFLDHVSNGSTVRR